MPGRRYDEEETRRIFDEASRAPALPGGASDVRAPEGFTLAELQEIGVEAGLDPDRIARAARRLDVDAGTAASVRRVAGVPIGVSRTVHLPGDFDEADWNRLVVDLRETFGARGRIRTEGAFRAWSNGNLQALVEPTDEGYRLRLRTVKGSARQLFTVGAMGLGMAVLLLVVFALSGRLWSDPEAWTGPLFLGLMGAGAVGVTALRLPPWARTRARQMEEVAARALLRAAERERDEI